MYKKENTAAVIGLNNPLKDCRFVIFEVLKQGLQLYSTRTWDCIVFTHGILSYTCKKNMQKFNLYIPFPSQFIKKTLYPRSFSVKNSSTCKLTLLS